jgi:hypothetical protein
MVLVLWIIITYVSYFAKESSTEGSKGFNLKQKI